MRLPSYEGRARVRAQDVALRTGGAAPTSQLLQVHRGGGGEHGVGKVVQRQPRWHIEREPANHERQHSATLWGVWIVVT